MRLFGLIGYPVTHSRSPELFDGIFQHEGVKDAMYVLFPFENLNSLRDWARAEKKLCGFNVTIPHKKEVMHHLDELSPEARAIGAVNTVKVIRTEDEAKLVGYNTDVFGFSESLRRFLQGFVPEKALILGTGGSSLAVDYALKIMGIHVIKVSRDPSGPDMLSYEDLDEGVLSSTHLIVNTTPMGMWPNTKGFPPIPYKYLTEQHHLFDLVYNPPQTVFMSKGLQHGGKVINGFEMLQMQARKAWEIWNG